MDFLIGAGLVCGVLAGIWIPGSIVVGFTGWVAFLAWATYYAIGVHGLKAFKGTIIVNMVGVFWGFIMATLAGVFGPIMGQLPGLGLAVFIGTVFMLWQAKWIPALKFIPGVFLGAAAFFGSGYDLKGAIIALLCGAVIAFLSEKGSQLIAKKQPQEEEVADAKENA
jgi:hypothetical protein